jgi:L-asparagine oxygenase
MTVEQSQEISLTAHESDQVLAAIDGLPRGWAERRSADGLAAAAVAGRFLPGRVVLALTLFRRWSNESGTLVIRGLPVNQGLPSTPNDGRGLPGAATRVSEGVLSVLMSQMGDPIAYADEKEGAIIQEVCPLKGHESRQENSGSTFLEFHTENGFHPFRPDFLGLVCLRSDDRQRIPTLTSSVRRLLPLLSDSVESALRRRAYRITPSSSFGEADPGIEPQPIAVLSGPPELPAMVVDCNAMEGIDSESAQALSVLRELLPSVADATVLDVGDLLILDNRVAAHARGGWTPRYDGRDRWLQRMSVVGDFRRTQVAREPWDHTCHPLRRCLKETSE